MPLFQTGQAANAGGQSLLEFALVLPIILLLVLGIFEFGRILFVYSELSNSTREAARFGSTTGQSGIGTANFLDCDAIRNAARNTAFLSNYADGDIAIGYETPITTTGKFSVFAHCGDAGLDPDDVELGDRVVVTITHELQPILSILPIPDFSLDSVSRRTVVKDIPAGPPQCRDGRDNDGDGDIDFPADTGCTGADDTIEAICYRLTVISLPTDGGVNSIVPEPNCSNRYIETTNVILEATPAVGYIFDQWSGAIGGTDNPVSFPISADSDVIANFSLLVDLAVTKSAAPDPVRVGDPISYLISVSSTGVSTATQVLLTEEIPPELTDVNVTPPPGGFCDFSTMPILTCTVPVLPANGGFSMEITGNAPFTPGTILTNKVTVGLGGDHQEDPNTSNNSYTLETEVMPKVNLSVTKNAPLEPVRDQPFDYEITVSNEGPLVATGVVLTDTLPPNLDLVFVASSGLCVGTTLITCDLPDIPAGGSTGVTIRVIPTEIGFISNFVEVAGTLFDHEPANDSDTADSTVRAFSNLSVEKVGSPATVYDGETVNYTLSVSNAADMSTATNVVVTDILPVDRQNVDLASISASTGTCQVVAVTGPANDTLICNVPQLEPGAVETISFSIEAVSPGTMVNSVEVAADEIDSPSGGPNTAGAQTTVLPLADLSVSKTASNPVLLSPLTYTITVMNVGPSDGTGVEVRDTLPVGFDFISASTGCSAPDINRVVVCSIPPLNVTENFNPPPAVSYDFVITVRPTTAGLFTNLVEVTGNELDPVTSNNSFSHTIEVMPSADLSVTKTTTPPTGLVGTPLTYTLSVMNTGPSDVTGVVVEDMLPADFVFVSAGPNCTYGSGHKVSCTIAVLDVDESVSPPTPALAQLTITVIPIEVGSYDNVVTVANGTDDPDMSNNSFTHTIVVGIAATSAVPVQPKSSFLAARMAYPYFNYFLLALKIW